MNYRIKNQPTFRKLILSYFVLLLFTLLITVLIFCIASNSIVSEVEKVVEMSVLKMRSDFDDMVNTMIDTSAVLASQGEIISVMSEGSAVRGKVAIQLEALRQILRNLTLSNATLSDAYVFLPKTRTVVSDAYAYGSAISDAYCEKRFLRNFDDTYQMLTSAFPKEITLVRDSVGGYHLVAVTPVLYANRYEYGAAAVVTLNTQRLREMLASFETIDGTYLIQAGTDVLRSNSAYDSLLAQTLTYPNGLSSQRLGGDTVISMVLDSTYEGFRCVALIPYGVFTKELNAFRRIVLLILTGCACLGAIISIFSAKSITQPLKRLLRVVSSDGNHPKNEFDYLEKQIVTLMEKRREGEVLEQKYDDLMRQHLLVSLLLGHVNDEESFFQANRRHKLGVLGHTFRVVAVYASVSYPTIQKARNGDQKLIRVVLSALIGHTLSNSGEIVAIEHKGNVFFIVNEPRSDVDTEAVQAEMERAIDVLKETLYQSFLIIVSRQADGLSGIGKCYYEVEDMREDVSLYGVKQGVVWESVVLGNEKTAMTSGGYMYEERIIVSLLLSQDYEQAACRIRAQIEALHEKGVESVEAMRHLTRTVVLTLEDTRSAFPHGFFEALDVRERLLSAASVDEMRLAVNEIFGSLTRYENEQGAKMTGVARKIADYIDHNYADPLLAREYIADALGISVSHLSHAYKLVTSATVMDGVHDRRIRAAKELLQNNDMTLQKVAESVGYTNTWTLTRAFKSREGISPGKYREQQM